MDIYEMCVKIIGIAFIVFLIFLFVAVFVRSIARMFATVKTVDAVVVKKYKVDEFTKYSGTGTKSRCVVVFESGSKLLRLNVSEITYKDYKVNEKGKLTYKGNRIIEFR